eukprot:350792-Chlamydomonas_euryale.AAC.3
MHTHTHISCSAPVPTVPARPAGHCPADQSPYGHYPPSQAPAGLSPAGHCPTSHSFAHACVVPTPDVVSPISQVLSCEGPVLSALLGRALPGQNHWHVKGYRYRVRDSAMGCVRCAGTPSSCTLGSLCEHANGFVAPTACAHACRASPGRKVATMRPSSLHLVAHISDRMHCWAYSREAAVATRTSSDGSDGDTSGGVPPGGSDSELEPALNRQDASSISSCGRLSICAGGLSDDLTWAAAFREPDGRQLLAAMESVPDSGLAGAAAHARALAAEVMPGAPL